MKDNVDFLKEARNGHLQNIRSANNVILFILASLVAVYRELNNPPPYVIAFVALGITLLVFAFIYISNQRKQAKEYLYDLKYL